MGASLLCAPAEAATLEAWRFDRTQNRLELRTDQGVQPVAQLVFSPTRLVIDLPGINLGRPKVEEAIGGTIRSLRIAQFDRQTTRVVVELAPGYTIDPNQVRFQGTFANRWTVTLPTPRYDPQLGAIAVTPPSQSTPPGRPAPTPPRPTVPTTPGVVVVPDSASPPTPSLPPNRPGTVVVPDSASPPPTSSPRPTPPTSPRPVPTPSIKPPTERVVVVIDPGHGGPDPGAIGIGGLRETDVVLPVAKQIATLLEKQGVEAILTRSTERDLDLAPRVNLAEEVDATVFVSIHANAVGLSRPEVNGLETYYYDSGLDLANTIHRTILEDVNVTDRRVRKANFYVLRETSMPAVLVELGFVTGATDAARLRNPTYRNQMAAAIARGILRYLQRI